MIKNNTRIMKSILIAGEDKKLTAAKAEIIANRLLTLRR